MTTIKKEIKIVGNGLMKNIPCELTMFPSKSGQIRYFVKDKDSFTADVDNVLSTDHCVVLGTKKARAMLTEHLTAALAFYRKNYTIKIRFFKKKTQLIVLLALSHTKNCVYKDALTSSRSADPSAVL